MNLKGFWVLVYKQLSYFHFDEYLRINEIKHNQMRKVSKIFFVGEVETSVLTRSERSPKIAFI